MDKYGFKVIIEQDEDGMYIATVPALKSCYTQAKTIEKLMKRIKEVIELCLETEENDYLSSGCHNPIKIMHFQGITKYRRYTYKKNYKSKIICKRKSYSRALCKHNGIKAKGRKFIYE